MPTFFNGGELLASQAEEPPLVGSALLHIYYICRFHLYLEAISFIGTWGRSVLWWPELTNYRMRQRNGRLYKQQQQQQEQLIHILYLGEYSVW